jgi:tRNA-dihydrouridine synthase A
MAASDDGGRKGPSSHVDGAMLGRAAYQDPAILLEVDRELFGEEPQAADPFDAIALYEPYMAARLAEGLRLHTMTRHMLGLFNGRPGARAYRPAPCDRRDPAGR